MRPDPPRTAIEKQAALEERDRRRRRLETAWARIEPELHRAGHGGRCSTSRRDGRIVLTFTGRTPVDVRPLLEAHGVSELFVLEADDDDDAELFALGDELRDTLGRAGFDSHAVCLDGDGTGPVVLLTHEPDAGRAREADAICGRFAVTHGCGAGWEHDPDGPFRACLPIPDPKAGRGVR